MTPGRLQRVAGAVRALPIGLRGGRAFDGDPRQNPGVLKVNVDKPHAVTAYQRGEFTAAWNRVASALWSRPSPRKGIAGVLTAVVRFLFKLLFERGTALAAS